jgi:glycosyltransferase involved in cell wall biosynthesis
MKDLKDLNVLSLGYTRDLLSSSEEEIGESSDRMGFYAKFLKNYFVLVFSLKKHNLSAKKTGNMTIIPTQGIFRIDALFKMYSLADKICRENKIDIIQAQDPVFMGVIGLLLKRKYKIVLNTIVYGCNPYDKYWVNEKKLNLILAPIAKNVLKNSDGIQVDGLKVLNSLKRNGLDSSKIFYKPVIPKSINLFKEADGNRVRKQLLKEGENKLLLFVGRLSLQKNIPFLIACFQDIAKKFLSVRLVIIGEGEEEKKLKDFSGKLGLEDKITWIKSLPYAKIPEYFKACDVFLLPSLYEGFPKVLMEATMSGKPIISTDISGTEEVVMEGESGFIIPQGGREKFVEKTLFLLRNEKTTEKMGKRAQEIITEKFDPDKTRLEQINIWEKLIKNKSCSGEK